MKVRAYRLNYRGNEPEIYGWIRLITIVSFCIGTLIASLLMIESISLVAFLLVSLFTIVYSNFIEYFIHRWPMHTKFPLMKKLYKIHSGNHHRYFTDEYMNIETKQDVLSTITNFSAVLMLVFAIIIPTSLLLGFTFGYDVGVLFYACAIGYYLFYELTHFVSHLPFENVLLKIPYFKSAKIRHSLHHNTKMMREWNFNVSYPIFDKVFKTLHK